MSYNIAILALKTCVGESMVHAVVKKKNKYTGWNRTHENSNMKTANKTIDFEFCACNFEIRQSGNIFVLESLGPPVIVPEGKSIISYLKLYLNVREYY